MHVIPPFAPLPDTELILHLGLPKTGTSSLQRDMFPHLPHWHFLGAQSPRDSVEQTACFKTISGYVMHEKGDVQEVKQVLRAHIDAHGPVLISEECFLIGAGHHAGETWQARIKRLEALTAAFRREAWVTLRPWRAGVESYFFELANVTMPAQAPPPLWWLTESNMFGIWRINELREGLCVLTCPVRWIPFEAIASGQFAREVLNIQRPMEQRNRSDRQQGIREKVFRYGLLERVASHARSPVVRYLAKGVRHRIGDVRFHKTVTMERWTAEIWSQTTALEAEWQAFMAQQFPPNEG